MGKKRLKAAAVQLASDDNKERNVARAVKFVKQAISAGAELVVLPETFNYRGDAKDLAPIAEEIPGKSLLPLIDLAKKHSVWILAGSVYEKARNSTKPYNTSVLIDNSGDIVAKYRKIHRFDISIDGKEILESKRNLAGKEIVVAEIDGIKVGLSVCYDVRFPELYRKYSEKGVELICIPSSFTAPTGEAHWEVLVRARAIENQCFVIAPNQSGVGAGGVRTFGNSMIVDPWGRIMTRAAQDSEEVIYANLDLAELHETRKNLPALEHRRL